MVKYVVLKYLVKANCEFTMYLVCEQHIGIPSILGNVHAGSAIFSKRFLPIMDINSFLLCFVILTSRFGQYSRTVLRDRLYSSIVTETLPILPVFISLGHSCRKYIPHKTLLVFIIYGFNNLYNADCP